MTNGTTSSSGPPVGIDRKGWIEPSELYPAEVVVSHYRECDEKYMLPNDFRKIALPRPIWQWDLRVKALDRVLETPEGERVDAIRYGGFDLERLNTREYERLVAKGTDPHQAALAAIEPVNIFSNKEGEISDSWSGVFGNIEPPEVLEGKKIMAEFFPQKRVGRRNVAKRVLLAREALPPDYTFDGEVEVIKLQRRDDEDTPEPTSTEGTSHTASATDAKAAIPALLNGKNKNNLQDIIKAVPAELRNGNVIQALIDGSLLNELQTEGTITVTSDGTIKAQVAPTT